MPNPTISSEVQFPAYYKVVTHRNNILLRPYLRCYPNPTAPVGIHVPYATFVQHTFNRLMTTLTPPLAEDFPLNMRIADGLDSSGSHRVYNQHNTSTVTKSFILFCFNRLQLQLLRKRWKDYTPNSPYWQRPIFFFAAKENENNIREFRTEIINPDTDEMENEMFSIGENIQAKVDTVRTLLCSMEKCLVFFQVQGC